MEKGTLHVFSKQLTTVPNATLRYVGGSPAVGTPWFGVPEKQRRTKITAVYAPSFCAEEAGGQVSGIFMKRWRGHKEYSVCNFVFFLDFSLHES